MDQALVIPELCASVPVTEAYGPRIIADAVTDFRGNPFVGLFRMAAMETPIIKRLESGSVSPAREPGKKLTGETP